MSLFSELREDLRLARLNNPGYGFFFKLLDIAGVFFKLLLLGAFGLGIWHIVYDFGATEDARISAQTSPAVEQSAPRIVESTVEQTVPEVAALTPERVKMLRQFAVEHRSQENARPASISEVAGAVVTEANDSIITKVERPRAIVDQSALVGSETTTGQIIAAAELTPLPVIGNVSPDSSPLELESTGVFDALEKKLQLAPDITESRVTAIEPEEPVAQSAADTGSLVAPATNVVAETVTVEDNGGINEDRWILAQNPDRYTIQIGSTSNRPFLVRFSNLLPEGQPVALYHYVFRSRPEYGLSYGLFDSKAEANAALERLSPKVRRYGAFARKLSIVHQQIEELSEQVALAQK